MTRPASTEARGLRLPFSVTAVVMSLFVPSAAVTATDRDSQASERVYAGRTLDEWRERIGHLDLGGKADPGDVEGLRLIVTDRQAPWFTRRQAALTLGRMGASASSVIPDLVRLLDESSEPVETSTPLWSLKALALFGAEAHETTPRIVELIQDKSAPYLVRLTATEPLGRIGSAHPLAVATLIDVANETELGTNDSESLELRVAVIEALELARVPDSLPALMIATEDSAERVRLAAVTTMGSLGSGALPAVELLASVIAFDESLLVREAAGRSLSRIGAESLPVLVQLTELNDVPTRRIAVEAIGRIGPAARRHSDVVEKLVADEAPAVARAALGALWAVSADPPTVLPHLVESLSSDDRDLRKVASDVLLRLGEAAAPAKPALEKLLESGSESEQAAARRVLKILTGSAEQPGGGAPSP